MVGLSYYYIETSNAEQANALGTHSPLILADKNSFPKADTKLTGPNKKGFVLEFRVTGLINSSLSE